MRGFFHNCTTTLRLVAFQIRRYFGCHVNVGGRDATPLETASSIKQQKIMLKPLQFLNPCINRIKRQTLAMPMSPTLGCYNGHQLVLQT